MLEAQPIGNRRSKWAESPIWHDNKLSYVDIESREIIHFNPETLEEQCIKLDQRIGFIALTRDNNWIWGGDNGLYLYNVKTQKHQLIDNPEPDKIHNRFNDGKVSPDGSLFAGTISLIKKPEAALYQLSHNKKLNKVFGPVTNSNGLAWSLDNKILYYIDTPSKEIKAFNYDSQRGVTGDYRIAISTSHIKASPDGMCIDNEGNLWIAFCHGGCVISFNPSTGKEVRRINVPALETTSCCFGGPEGNDLYITTGIPKTEKEEFSGSIFVVKSLDVKGHPINLYRGS